MVESSRYRPSPEPKLSLDLYAASNPALGAAVIWAFLNGVQEKEGGLEFPLVFLPLPILLSSSIAQTFEGTNSRTGFYGWLERNPGLQVDLPAKIDDARTLTRQSLLFGFRAQLIDVTQTGVFFATRGLSETRLRQTEPSVKPIFALSKRLGGWLAEVGSTRDVLYALGLTV